jgi:multidrug efflux pump subunit AcrB
MNPAEFFIRKSTISWVCITILAVGGIMAYRALPRLEDPAFTIKDALVVTPYPGATAREVETEISERIEIAAQKLAQLERVTSLSQPGLSTVTVTVKDEFDKTRMPQVWDELRRVIGDEQSKLPPGAGPSLVIDDFGDVYGIFLAITGDGYSYAELIEYVKDLEKKLLKAPDVKGIKRQGTLDEAIYVELSTERMAGLGIDANTIYTALAEKGLVADAGRTRVGDNYLAFRPTGDITGVADMEDLLITADGERLIFLRDLAEVKRDYKDPPASILRHNRKQAIGLGISNVPGGNVVTMGEAVKKMLKDLEGERPVGIEIQIISFQSVDVIAAVNAFVVNLMQAIAIVVVVLLLFMGLRSGLIIGAVLFLTVAGTMIILKMLGDVSLERISLGALIIALGMLVDNAIVITEGMLIRIQKGEDRLEAAKAVVGQNFTPLLGATLVAILAFAAIGLSQDSTGEFCRSLFIVVGVSLLFSWATAITVTPLLCFLFIKATPLKPGEEQEDPYKGALFQVYQTALRFCLRFRTLTLAVVVGIFGLSLFLFQFTDKSFFPDSSRPQFLVDMWLPEGTHIRVTEEAADGIEEFILSQPGVTEVATIVGEGALRFILTYSSEKSNTSYAQFIVKVDDYKKITGLIPVVRDEVMRRHPDAIVGAKRMILGPGEGGKIQVRVSSPVYEDVRAAANAIMQIMRDSGNAQSIRTDWREQIPQIRPVLIEEQARIAGISLPILSSALLETFAGRQIGVFREEDKIIPILARAPEEERLDLASLDSLSIWSPAAQAMIPMRQVVSDFETGFEDSMVWRRNRVPTITIHCDPIAGQASKLREAIAPAIEAVDLGPSGFLEWGGEYENSGDAQAGIAASLPFFFVIMVVIVIFLFNSLKQPLVIWLTVPLAMIGVSLGLLATSQPFGFMALLGTMSLSGMLIKNAIVLIDEMDARVRSGVEASQAVVGACVSRLRPVSMAALTTILGMMPLVLDPFFVSMAVTIMAGLACATLLTMFVVPVLYTLVFKIPVPKNSH